MSEEESFVRHIRANPQDEAARLIYADYLEERGDPRGELIRVQCELDRLDIADPARLDLAARETQLLADHADEWLAPLRRLGAIGISARCFHRGLIERAVFETEDFLANAGSVGAVAPALHTVRLRGVRNAVAPLAAKSLPTQVRSLDVSSNRLGPQEMSRLKTAEWIGQIEEFCAPFNNLADEGATQIASVPWPRLRVLSLARNKIGPAGAQSLASASMPALVSLSLQLNPIGSPGVRALTGWPQLARLEELDLAAACIQSQGASMLAQSGVLASVRRLSLRGNRISDAAMRELDKRKDWTLDLRANLGVR